MPLTRVSTCSRVVYEVEIDVIEEPLEIEKLSWERWKIWVYLRRLRCVKIWLCAAKICLGSSISHVLKEKPPRD
jgi:hypothetical protein